MTKPRLAKVRALFYVLQQVTKEAAPILTQPRQGGFLDDAEIDSVKYIRWSRKMAIIQRLNSSWWVVKATGDSLRCYNHDTIVGPLDDKAVQPYLSEMTDVIQEMHVTPSIWPGLF